MKSFTTKQIGDKGEEYAALFLRKNNYKIIARNFRKKYGEIDIIAEKNNIIIFVEVKTRQEKSLTQPFEAVDKQKQRRLIKTAYAFILENTIEKNCRFDVCEVFVKSHNLKLININYIENAFEQESNYELY